MARGKIDRNNLLALAFFVLSAEFAGILGSVFTASAIDSWYVGLVKPSFNPPNWVFGPVWTVLYLLMGVAAYLVWRVKPSKFRLYSLRLYFFQLVLNFLWSLVFFGYKLPGVAFVEIVVLWWMILFTIYYFYKVRKLAAYLMFPYLVWVSFASVLNYYLWVLN